MGGGAAYLQNYHTLVSNRKVFFVNHNNTQTCQYLNLSVEWSGSLTYFPVNGLVLCTLRSDGAKGLRDNKFKLKTQIKSDQNKSSSNQTFDIVRVPADRQAQLPDEDNVF